MASRPPTDIAKYLKATPKTGVSLLTGVVSNAVSNSARNVVSSVQSSLLDTEYVINNIRSPTDVTAYLRQTAKDGISAVGNSLLDSAVSNLPFINTDISGAEIVDEDGIQTVTAQPPRDHRFRLSALSGRENDVYGSNQEPDNLISIFHNTGGLMFPYTPSVSFTQPVTWQSMELMNTNYDILSYNRTPSPTIGLTGKFTCQNRGEARYSLAVIHFMRTLSKGGFGQQDAKDGVAGLPPRVMRLNGYGKHMFNDVRCVIRGSSWTFDENVDTVQVNFNGEYARIPMVFTVTFELGIVVSPKTQREEFSSSKFRSGILNSKNNFGFI